MIDDLWSTVSKYPRFLFSVIAGVIFNFLAPLVPLMKNPITAVALVGAFLGGFAFLAFTLRAMLGLS